MCPLDPEVPPEQALHEAKLLVGRAPVHAGRFDEPAEPVGGKVGMDLTHWCPLGLYS